MTHTEIPAASTGTRRWCAAIIVTSLAAIACAVLSQWKSRNLLDDAFMYIRYADHILKYGVVSWNPNGPPTFGATSLVHLAIVTLVRWAGVSRQAVLLLNVSTAIGALFLAALSALAMETANRGSRLIAVTATLALLVPGVSMLAQHFVSGMDTVTAMLFLSLFLLAILICQRRRSRGAFIAAALMAPLMMLVRPDLLVFTFVLPAAWWLWPPRDGDRRLAFVTLLYLAAITALTLWAQHQWLGSVLPLPFWAKTGSVYGRMYATVFHLVSAQTLVEFLCGNGIALTAICGVILAGPARFWRESDVAVRGITIALLVFVAFYSMAVLPILDVAARFYHPVLPAFAVIAIRSCSMVWVDFRRGSIPSDVADRLRVAVGGVTLVLLLMHVGQEGLLLSRSIFYHRAFITDITPTYIDDGPCWQRPFALPTEVSFGVTEAGILGANSERVVYDLVGINSAEFLAAPLDPAVILARRPDALLGLHHDYHEQLDRLKSDPAFLREYLILPDEEGPDSDMYAIRRQSPYFNLLKSSTCR